MGRVPLGLLALVYLAFISVAAFLPAELWIDTLLDDAYYYLGVARHMALGDGSMFAPPLATNGYQPLWMLILSAMAFLVEADRRAMVLGIHLIGLAAVAAFVWLSKRDNGVAWPAALMVLCYPYTIILGMETVLLPFLVLLYFRSGGYRRGVLAGLIFLTRLDALGLIAGAMAYEFLKTRRIDYRQLLVLIPVCLGYFALNHALFGVAVPISGLAKAVGNVKGENYLVPVRYAFMFLPVAALLLLRLLDLRSLKGWTHEAQILPLLFSLAASTFYYYVFSGWWLSPWYYWSIALLFYYAILELRTFGRRDLKWARVVFVGLLCFQGVTEFVRPFRGVVTQAVTGRDAPLSWGQQNLHITRLIGAQDLPPSLFAMGDRAGSFGFFLDDRHGLVQTEGLVADRAYFEALKSGQGEAFLESLKVDYYVSHRDLHWRFGDTYAFPEPLHGLSARHGIMLLCFNVADEIPHGLQDRTSIKLFRFEQRRLCPERAMSVFEERKKQYAMVRATSFREHFLGL